MQAHREKPPKRKTSLAILAYLLIGIPLGVLCGASLGGLLLYGFFSAREPGWEKLPSPPEKAARIVRLTSSFDDVANVLLQTETGSLYTCRLGDAACQPSKLSQEQAAKQAVARPCFNRPQAQELSPRPPGKLVDSCTVLWYGEAANIVVLLEDNSLWYRSEGSFDIPLLAAMGGALLGAVLGLIASLVWIIKRMARRSSASHDPR